MVYLKPKQLGLIIKDCARRFVSKLYRHGASRGLFATAELLVVFLYKTLYQYSDGYRHSGASSASGEARSTISTVAQWILVITASMDDKNEEKKQNLFVRSSGKSESEVTNNRRLRSRYCTIEANYLQTRSIARPLRQQSYLFYFCAYRYW